MSKTKKEESDVSQINEAVNTQPENNTASVVNLPEDSQEMEEPISQALRDLIADTVDLAVKGLKEELSAGLQNTPDTKESTIALVDGGLIEAVEGLHMRLQCLENSEHNRNGRPAEPYSKLLG